MTEDFDPKAYLADKRAGKTAPADGGPFDPKAYLAAKRVERQKAKRATNAQEIDALKADPENTIGDYFNAATGQIADKAAGVGRGAMALAGIAFDPGSLADAPTRRELLRGVDDVATLGYGRKLAGKLDEMLPAKLRLDLPEEERDAAGWDELSPRPSPLTSEQEADAAAAPDVRTGGNLVGAAVPSPVNWALKGLNRNVAAALPTKGAVGSAARAGVSYELAAPALAAAHADAGSVKDRLMAAGNAAKDPGNILLATGAGASVGGVSKLLRQDPWLKRFFEAKEKGLFDTEEMKALPKHEQGIHEAAVVGQKKVLGRELELDAAAAKRYQEALNPQGPKAPRGEVPRDQGPPAPDPNADLFAAARRIDAPNPEAPTPQGDLLAAARRVDLGEKPPAAPYVPPAEPVPPQETMSFAPEGLRRPIDQGALVKSLRAQRAKSINPDSGQPFDPDVTEAFDLKLAELENTPQSTVGGALGARRSLRDQADFGNPNASPKQKAKRGVYRAFRGAVREAAPDVAAADDEYAAHARTASRRRDIVYGTEDRVTGEPRAEPLPEGGLPTEAADDLMGPRAEAPQLRVQKEKQAARFLKRTGDTNVPGQEAAPFLQELAAMDPEFAAAIDFVGAKKALEGTRFVLKPSLATDIHGVGPWGSALNFGKQNVRALGRYAGDPDVRGGGTLQLTEPFQRVAREQLTDAQEEEQKRKRKRAESLTKGKH